MTDKPQQSGNSERRRSRRRDQQRRYKLRSGFRSVPADVWWLVASLQALVFAIALRQWTAAILFLGTLLLPAIGRALRRPTPYNVAVVSVILGAITWVLWLPEVLAPTLGGNSPPATPRTKAVFYAGDAYLEGERVRIEEEVTVDAGLADEEWSKVNGWRMDRIFDEKPVFGRERFAEVHGKNRLESKVELPINLGAGVQGTLVPGEGSILRITAPKGALGAMTPTAQQLVDAPERKERASVPLGPADDRVVINVRPPVLRSPVGISVDGFLAWGWLPWLVGVLGGVVTTVVVGRLTLGADSILGRLLRHPSRPAPPSLACDEQGGAHPAPRRRLRGGGARLLVRNRRRRP